MDIFIARQIAARIWCEPEYSGYSMNPELVEKIAYLLLEEAISQSYTRPTLRAVDAATGAQAEGASDTRRATDA